MLSPQFIGVVGLVAIAACWSLATVLYRVESTSPATRQLATLLVIEGFVLLSAGFPDFASGLPIEFWEEFYHSHATLELVLIIVHHIGDAAMVALYPPFLALALETNLTRPFKNPRVRLALAIVSFGAALAVIVSKSQIVTTLFYALVAMVFIFALVASIDAWRASTRGVARERAGIFAVAFGVRDAGWCLSYAIAAWLMWTTPDPFGFAMPDSAWLGKLVYALGTLLAVPLVAYGILRGLLFDIDLKIRWTIKQSTVAAVFVTIFYIVSEGSDRLLSSELGNVFGLLASALVVFFLTPLQRFADRLAGAAMPNTQSTPEYAAFRKMQVYESALIDALPDGQISNRERVLLDRLRDSLNISVADAEAIERELRHGRASSAAWST